MKSLITFITWPITCMYIFCLNSLFWIKTCCEGWIKTLGWIPFHSEELCGNMFSELKEWCMMITTIKRWISTKFHWKLIWYSGEYLLEQRHKELCEEDCVQTGYHHERWLSKSWNFTAPRWESSCCTLSNWKCETISSSLWTTCCYVPHVQSMKSWSFCQLLMIGTSTWGSLCG